MEFRLEAFLIWRIQAAIAIADDAMKMSFGVA
jgi:hypothetical protein